MHNVGEYVNYEFYGTPQYSGNIVHQFATHCNIVSCDNDAEEFRVHTSASGKQFITRTPLQQA
jgi:hypothetical protein